jgi:hypothetical protein
LESEAIAIRAWEPELEVIASGDKFSSFGVNSYHEYIVVNLHSKKRRADFL